MQNEFLGERSARDIDKRVAKLLKDLGSPEPPLRLEVVRELLELDLAYYSSSDAGVLKETVHRLKVAGKQVIRRPFLLLDVVRRLDLKALWVPDRKRILIDSELPSPKQRWGEAHEIGHSIIPWHEPVMHGDKQRTLSYSCHQQVEAEANFAAGRLLFLQEAFDERVKNEPLTFNQVKKLGKEFGNTMTSTLWRTVESTEEPLFGMVSQHPRRATGESNEAIRYFLRSRKFADEFSGVTPVEVFESLQQFCYGNLGPIGSDEVVYRDANGERHVFFVETFFNHHEALTLGVHRRKQSVVVAVR